MRYCAEGKEFSVEVVDCRVEGHGRSQEVSRKLCRGEINLEGKNCCLRDEDHAKSGCWSLDGLRMASALALSDKAKFHMSVLSLEALSNLDCSYPYSQAPTSEKDTK